MTSNTEYSEGDSESLTTSGALPLLHMARVSRMAAARSGHGGSFTAVSASQRAASVAEKDSRNLSLYPSINTLRSEQDDDDVSCKECCKTVLSYVYNYTIASCVYSACHCFRRGNHLTHNESSVSVEDMEISEMKEKLKFHFMNPFQKWRYEPRRRFPWKLIVQLSSIILVTAQLVLFAQTKFALTDFIRENTRTFVKLFVATPADTFGESVPIPSPISYLYTMDDVLDQINFTANAYFNLREGAVGTYGYEWRDLDDHSDETKVQRQLWLNVTRYANGKIDPTSRTFNVTAQTIMKHYNITHDDLDALDDVIEWEKLVDDMNVIQTFTLEFQISSIFVDHGATNSPKGICFQFLLLFTIKNEYRTGNMPLTLTVETIKSDCRDDSTPFQLGTSFDSSAWFAVLDSVVILISFISLFLCIRSLINSWRLAVTVRTFFKMKFDNFRLKVQHLLPLFNGWHLMVITSNALVIVGSFLKILISYSIINNIEVIDITSIILGLAVFGQWCGLLRFLSYFDKYNMLLLTLRISAPSVMRFIICTGILYIAFLLCGWLVMGPYHPKFRTLSITSECLFSLVNGDDMYNTYIMMSQASQAAWIFSKIYLYIFIALFIYVVLSVFISLISDTYETLHEHWRDRSKGLLQDFASGKLGHARAHSHTHMHTHSLTSIDNMDEDYDLLRDITRTASYGATDQTPLIVNGGPELSRTPPSYKRHLTTSPTLHAAGHGQRSPTDTNQFSDEGVEPGNGSPSQPLFRLES